MNRKQFTFYRSFYNGIRRIRNKANRCDAYDAVVAYALDGVVPDMDKLSDAAALAFELIFPTLESARRQAEGGAKSTASSDEADGKVDESMDEQGKGKGKGKGKGQTSINNNSNELFVEIVDAWNSLGLSQVTKILPGSTRAQNLNAREKEHGKDAILKAIENVRSSTFLKGQNQRGWIVTLDWFLKPTNFQKVLDGNYTDAKPAVTKKSGTPYGGNTDPSVARAAYLQLCEELGEDPEEVTA